MTGEDPYVDANGILLNKLGITSGSALSQAEADLSLALRAVTNGSATAAKRTKHSAPTPIQAWPTHIQTWNLTTHISLRLLPPRPDAHAP